MTISNKSISPSEFCTVPQQLITPTDARPSIVDRRCKKFLDFLQKLEESPAAFRITALQSKALRKFMKKKYVNAKTGEAVNSSDIKGFIDFDKVAEYKKSMGYRRL